MIEDKKKEIKEDIFLEISQMATDIMGEEAEEKGLVGVIKKIMNDIESNKFVAQNQAQT